MKEESKYGSRLGFVFLSLPFLNHILVLERYRNGFVEYDRHFLPVVLCFLFALLFFKLLKAPLRNYWVKLDIISILGAILTAYISVRILIANPADYRSVIYPLVLLSLYFLYKGGQSKLSTLSLFFTWALLITASIDVADIQLIKGVFFLKDAVKINSGENANYYASVIPFLFSLLVGKGLFSSSKWKHYIFTGAAFLLCSYVLYKCGARAACIGGLCGIVIVALKTPFARTFLMKKMKWGILGVSFVLVALISIFFTTKAIYNRNPKSVQGRFLVYEVTTDLIMQSPVLGHGPQSFKKLYNLNQSEYIRTHDIPIQKLLLADDCYFAFNEFLQILAELGIVGFFIVLIVIGLCAKITRRTNLTEFEIGAIGSLSAIGLCALFSYPFHTSSVLISAIFFLAILSHRLKEILFLKLSKRKVMTLLGVCISIFWFFSFKEWIRFKALKNWEIAAHTVLISGFPQASNYYSKALEELNTHGTFLYNYGSETYISGSYREGMLLLKQSAKYYSSSDLYTYLGDAYKMLKHYKDAEAAYRIAESIQPAKFLPKVQLLRLYQASAQTEQARKMAGIIIDFPVKIPSQKVFEYKTYARAVLEKRKN